jgi:hypothetical protein
MNRIKKEYLKKRKVYVQEQNARYGEASLRRGLCALQGLRERDLYACSGRDNCCPISDTPGGPCFCNLEGVDITEQPLENLIGEFPFVFPDGKYTTGLFLVDIRADVWGTLSVSVCAGIPSRLAGGTTVYHFKKGAGMFTLKKAVDELTF